MLAFANIERRIAGLMPSADSASGWLTLESIPNKRIALSAPRITSACAQWTAQREA